MITIGQKRYNKHVPQHHRLPSLPEIDILTAILRPDPYQERWQYHDDHSRGKSSFLESNHILDRIATDQEIAASEIGDSFHRDDIFLSVFSLFHTTHFFASLVFETENSEVPLLILLLPFCIS